jgi:NAD(P)-dependent dehydrogenase (short-subunit alcohol dehydrogenase family)
MQKLHVVIAGASGGVGEGLVTYFLSRGHRVTAIVRRENKKAALEHAIREAKRQNAEVDFAEVDFIVNAYRTEAEIGALTKEVKASGPVDIAVASLGGWYHGPALYNVPLPNWGFY